MIFGSTAHLNIKEWGLGGASVPGSHLLDVATVSK
jgi:hypothetical protein